MDLPEAQVNFIKQVVNNMFGWLGVRWYGRTDVELLEVEQFFRKFGFMVNDHPVHLKQDLLQKRYAMLLEEVLEFKHGMESRNLAEQADALIDLVYFAKGTALMMGLPWEALWADVHDANMSKVRGTGKRGHGYDVIKPKGWKPPSTHIILADHGYDLTQFTNEPGGLINDGRCYGE